MAKNLMHKNPLSTTIFLTTRNLITLLLVFSCLSFAGKPLNAYRSENKLTLPVIADDLARAEKETNKRLKEHPLELNISSLKLTNTNGFTEAEQLYLIYLIKDHPPMGWGAAGTTRSVEFKVLRCFRGNKPFDKTLKVSRMNPNNLRRKKVADDHPAGYYFASIYKVRGRDMIRKLVKASPETLKAAMVLSRVPIGWTIENNQLINPWNDVNAKPRLAGGGIELKVQPKPPKVKKKWTNPDGDGIYIITLTNTSKYKKEIPALLCKNNKIDWSKSLLVGANGQYQAIKQNTTQSKHADKVILNSGESITHEVNTFKLKNVKWPRGGYRIQFNFAIGELGQSASFYYMSSHHDALRNRLSGK